LRIVLKILSEIAGWVCALLVLGVIAANFLPHFDPQLVAPGSAPRYACYGIWNDIGSTYAFTCQTPWLRPFATWVNISCILITYTLRFLLMALGRGYDGHHLATFDTGLFEALAIFAVPTLLVLGFGLNFWLAIASRAFSPRPRRKLSVSGRVRG